jgi:hypothetical protein
MKRLNVDKPREAKEHPSVRVHVSYKYALETKQLRAIRILAEMLGAARARQLPSCTSGQAHKAA